MATLVSQLSQILQVTIPIAESINIQARKTVKLGEKYVSATFSEIVDYIINTNGLIRGFDLLADGTDLTLGSLTFINSGNIAVSDDSTTIVDSGSMSEPYYLYGLIDNDSSSPLVTFGLSQTADSTASILATKNVDWTTSTEIELGNLYESFSYHDDNQDIHFSQVDKAVISPPTAADSTNVFATHNDLYDYDRIEDSNDILTNLISLLELETNTSVNKPHKFKFSNMFADVIPIGYQVKPAGKYGTFSSVLDSTDIDDHLGMYGFYNATPFVYQIETGIFARVNEITDNILITAKETLLESPSGSTFDISTDGSTYEVLDISQNIVVDQSIWSGLSKSPNGTYDLNLRINIPAVGGGDYWTTKQSMTNAANDPGARFINNRVYSIGGYDSTGGDPGVQEYDIFNDSFRIFFASLIRRASPTSMDYPLGKVHLFNATDADATTIISDIAELTMANQSILNVATGLERWGSVATMNGGNPHKSSFGTGQDLSLNYTDEWKTYVNTTKAITTKSNYPLECSGVNSDSVESVPRKVYNYGAETAAGTVSSLISYDAINDSYETITPTEVDSPNTNGMGHGESFKFTLKRTAISVGRAVKTVAPPALDIYSDVNEYNIFQNTLSKKSDITNPIASSGLTVAANAKLYSMGGAYTDGAKDYNYEYTHDAMVYLYGWGIEWL